ncbi:MAG: IclR family transcriptional regulator [bacterium]|nr:IclR family transcriptional regulator [bacterium]
MAIASTFDKGLSLLDLFTLERPQLTLREVSEMSGISKPTAFRLLNTLELKRYLMRDRSKAYCLGLRFLELGNCVAERLDIRNIALPYIEELVHSVDRTVSLVIKDNADAVYIEKRETGHPVRLYTRVGRRAPLYAGACPRALIAFLPIAEMETIISAFEFHPVTPTTPMTISELRETIMQERKQGYTLSFGELFEGSAAIGMPIRDYTKAVVGAVSIAGPTSGFISEQLPFLIKALSRCVNSISREMGYLVAKGEGNVEKVH